MKKMNRKVLWMLAIPLVAAPFLLVGQEAHAGGLANSPWPMFHGGAQHGGQSSYNTSHVDGTIKWTAELGGAIESSPAIGADGTIYVGAHDNYLYAINPDGTQKWRFSAGPPSHDDHYNVDKGILSSPAIDSNGTIYFTTLADNLFAVNPDGTEKWRYPVHVHADVWSAPVIGSDGTIYVGSQQHPPGETDENPDVEGRLYAINPNGTVKWIYEDNSSGVHVSPALSEDGTLYSGAFDPDPNNSDGGVGKLLSMDAGDGSINWEFEFEMWQESSPTIITDGTIYIGSKEGKIYAINPDGTEEWSYQTGDGISATPAIGADGTIYVGGWDRYFYALNPDGTLKWRYLTREAYEGVSGSAAIGSDGTVYVTSNSGTFYAFNPDGTLKWESTGHGSMISSPAINANGDVFAGSWDNRLYAFSSGPRPIAERLAGRIVLQTEENGEAWYVDPVNLWRLSLGRPMDAWNIMRSTGLGITNADLATVPTYDNEIWTIAEDVLPRVEGRIVIQVEENGEAWYVSPVNDRRYYMGRPADAFQLMRNLGLGITNADLSQIPVNQNTE